MIFFLQKHNNVNCIDMVGDGEWYQSTLNETCVQEALNNYLVDYPYLDGYTPSQLDSSVHRSLKKLNIDLARHPYIKRWYDHIGTFTDEEKAVFRAEQNKIIPKLAYVTQHNEHQRNNDDTFEVRRALFNIQVILLF